MKSTHVTTFHLISMPRSQDLKSYPPITPAGSPGGDMCHAENSVITPNKANDISLPATEISINCNPYQNEEVRVRVRVRVGGPGAGGVMIYHLLKGRPTRRRQSS